MPRYGGRTAYLNLPAGREESLSHTAFRRVCLLIKQHVNKTHFKSTEMGYPQERHKSSVQYVLNSGDVSSASSACGGVIKS